MKIKVSANARLHMGFLDLHGGLGRQFGSIGVSINELNTSVTVSRIPNGDPLELIGLGEDADRALRYAEHFRNYIGSDVPLSIKVTQAIIPHAGLGSGTQMALAVGLAISQLLGRSDSPENIAGILDRGQRSGIGISCFKQGGFVIDGGRGASLALPPTLVQMPFPDEWRLLLLIDKNHVGVHGDEEIEAFQNLPRFPEASAAHLCRLTLMRLLPGLVEKDVMAFGAAITEIQQQVGDHFAPVQGGRFASPSVRQHIDWFEKQGVPGVGQSSWGPTGFVICANQEQASRLVEQVQKDIQGTGIEIHICKAMNKAGQIAEESS